MLSAACRCPNGRYRRAVGCARRSLSRVACEGLVQQKGYKRRLRVCWGEPGMRMQMMRKHLLLTVCLFGFVLSLNKWNNTDISLVLGVHISISDPES